MKNEIIPFGKYKGQPVEILQKDPEYTEWLLAQPWLEARFQSIRTIIINNFSEPTCTPEHNAMQARFLNKRLCFNVIETIFETRSRNSIRQLIEQIESSEWELWYCDEGSSCWIDMKFECHGWDVAINCEIEKRKPYDDDDKEFTGNRVFGDSWQILLELKPSLGEEFPEVLRQAKSRRGSNTVVIIDEFVAESVSLSDVKKMFSKSGILVLLSEEISNHELPECLR